MRILLAPSAPLLPAPLKSRMVIPDMLLFCEGWNNTTFIKPGEDWWKWKGHTRSLYILRSVRTYSHARATTSTSTTSFHPFFKTSTLEFTVLNYVNYKQYSIARFISFIFSVVPFFFVLSCDFSTSSQVFYKFSASSLSFFSEPHTLLAVVLALLTIHSRFTVMPVPPLLRLRKILSP